MSMEKDLRHKKAYEEYFNSVKNLPVEVLDSQLRDHEQDLRALKQSEHILI